MNNTPPPPDEFKVGDKIAHNSIIAAYTVMAVYPGKLLLDDGRFHDEKDFIPLEKAIEYQRYRLDFLEKYKKTELTKEYFEDKLAFEKAHQAGKRFNLETTRNSSLLPEVAVREITIACLEQFIKEKEKPDARTAR